MANEKPFTLEGSNRQSPTVDDDATLLVGTGIDRNTSGALALGGANTTSIVAAAPITTSPNQPGTLQTRSLAFSIADLTDAALSQVLNIGAVLPANAMIHGVDIKLATKFSGGGATAVSVDIGTASDDDAIVSVADLLAAAVDGVVSSMPSGIAPFKLFVSPGAQLQATVTSDVNVDQLLAGAATITITFTVTA